MYSLKVSDFTQLQQFTIDAWNKFVATETQDYTLSHRDNIVDFLNDRLKPHKGRLNMEGLKTFIIFESKSDAVMFLLRWG